MLLGHLETPLYSSENRMRTTIENSARHSLETRQLLHRSRSLSRDVEKHFIAHHTERCSIDFFRDRITPWHQLAQQGKLATRQVARALDAKKRKRRVVLLPFRSFEPLE